MNKRLAQRQESKQKYVPESQRRRRPSSVVEYFDKYFPTEVTKAEDVPALNSSQLLRAALGGNRGTINGASTDSAAALLRRAIVDSRMDHSG
ncbi:hypothetical protein A5N69_15315 [Prescottella equi]|nr:hypothetical protein A5N69_15315 [Prescottella equi]